MVNELTKSMNGIVPFVLGFYLSLSTCFAFAVDSESWKMCRPMDLRTFLFVVFHSTSRA